MCRRHLPPRPRQGQALASQAKVRPRGLDPHDVDVDARAAHGDPRVQPVTASALEAGGVPMHLRNLRPGHATFVVGLIAVMLFANSVAAGAAARAPRLSPEGIGPVRFGMNVDQAEAALGSPVDAEPGINDCTFWTFPGGAQGIAFGGRLGYISLFRRGTKTTRGIE